jgi:hypothetical protein
MSKIKLAALLALSTVFALGLNCIPNIPAINFQNLFGNTVNPL